MAIIKFENSKDLINYLCKKDVLGELKVSFEQENWTILEPSFNFKYEELHKHLYEIFYDWSGFYGQTATKVFITFTDAEDYSVTVEDNLQWSNSNLSEHIYEFVKDKISTRYDEEVYVLIDIEGTELRLEGSKVNKFEIHSIEGEEDILEIDEDFRMEILNGVFELLRNTKTCVMDVDNFYLQNTDGFDEIDFCVTGIPDVFDHYELKDGESFLLDTDLLKAS